MEYPTEEQLEEMLENLREQLRYCGDENIADELKKEIRYRETQRKELIIKNNIL